jgi:hypothetical protein
MLSVTEAKEEILTVVRSLAARKLPLAAALSSLRRVRELALARIGLMVVISRY